MNQFESSKYYVKPIPTFKPKVEIVEFQEKEEEEEEDSLAGCEITLIEDNIIICEDSALMELEL